MDEKTTEMLMNVLRSAGPADLEAYQARYLSQTCSSFAAYMDALIDARGITRQDLFQKADLPPKYGYKLLTGEAHTTDQLLRLFIALGLSLKETQRALALYGMPALYPKRPRDAVLIIALNQGIDSVDTVDQWLAAQHQPPLSRSRE